MQTVTTQGVTLPALGFGVFRMTEEEVERLVPAALDAGFRHFDTAQIYGNEAALGRALKSAGVSRGEIFLTTKVWVDNYDADRFQPSVEESLDKLQVGQVDLLLLHWPGSPVPLADQIARLNAARDAGLARAIGVSNQTIAQMRQSVALSAAPIVTNQVEIHPYLDQTALAAEARGLGLALTGYFGMADGAVPADPALQEIGARYGKTAAQVALRWQIDRGHVALSKTASPARLAENIAVFDFALDAGDMARIAALARPDGRIVSPEGLAPAWDA